MLRKTIEKVMNLFWIPCNIFFICVFIIVHVIVPLLDWLPWFLLHLIKYSLDYLVERNFWSVAIRLLVALWVILCNVLTIIAFIYRFVLIGVLSVPLVFLNEFRDYSGHLWAKHMFLVNNPQLRYRPAYCPTLLPPEEKFSTCLVRFKSFVMELLRNVPIELLNLPQRISDFLSIHDIEFKTFPWKSFVEIYFKSKTVCENAIVLCETILYLPFFLCDRHTQSS